MKTFTQNKTNYNYFHQLSSFVYLCIETKTIANKVSIFASVCIFPCFSNQPWIVEAFKNLKSDSLT